MWVLTLSPSYNRRNWGTEETGPKLETRCSPAAPKTQSLWAQGFAFSLCLPFFCFIHFLSSSFFSQKRYIDIRDTWHVLKPFRFLLASPSPILIMHSTQRIQPCLILQWPGNSLHPFLDFGHNLTKIHPRRWTFSSLWKPWRKSHRIPLWPTYESSSA